jgi:hypothetical protein
MELAGYEVRISAVERAGIQAAPVRELALAGEVFSYFPAEIVALRRKAHVQVPFIAESLAKGHVGLEVANIRFAECLAIAGFELSHGFVSSWAGFVLLFYKMFGPAVLPWLPSVFLAAVGQDGCPRPQFDLDEVLNFHQCHSVGSRRKFG